MVYGFWPGRHQPLRIDTSNHKIPFSMKVKLSQNHFYPLERTTKRNPEASYKDILNLKRMIEIRTELNCSKMCVLMIFSSLFESSQFQGIK